MSSRVTALARSHVLWPRRGWLVVGGVFTVAMINGMTLIRAETYHESDLRRIAALYALLAWIACLFSFITEFAASRVRISSVQRSLPATDREWLRAAALSRGWIVALVFVGALLANLLMVGITNVPAVTVQTGLKTFGASACAVAAVHWILGRQNRVGAWRITFALVPSFALLVLLLNLPEATFYLAVLGPLAMAVAWWRTPERVAPVFEKPAEQTPSAKPERVLLARLPNEPVQAMLSAMAWRSWGWWVETVASMALWFAFFVPLFAHSAILRTAGIGWCFVHLLLAGPTISEEKILKPIRHLPIDRGGLFPAFGIRSVLAPAIGIFLIAIGGSWTLSTHRATRVDWDSSLVATSDETTPLPVNVRVPGEYWRVAFGAAPITITLDDGESFGVRPRAVLPSVYVWHPYQLPENCSVATAGKQMSRALRELHGIERSAEDLEESFEAMPGGEGVRLRDRIPSSFSRGVGERTSVYARIADAPILFLPMFLMLTWCVRRKFRVRQLPRRKLTTARLRNYFLLGVAISFALHKLIYWVSDEDTALLVRSVMASMRELLLVPTWMLFLACLMLVRWLWRTTRRQVAEMEVPSVLGAAQQPS